MKQLVIFDLDGTLLNTIADLGEATNYALRKGGFAEHPLPAYNYMVGNGVRKLMERAAPEADAGTIDRLLGYFKEHYEQHCMDHTFPYPGMPELLLALVGAGIKVAVVSNKYQEAVDRIVERFYPEIPFAAVRGEREGCPKKPDPSAIFAVLGDVPTRKEDVLMVGDSDVDIEAARRACVESVGVTWGFRPVSDLREACADHIVSEPAGILGIATG